MNKGVQISGKFPTSSEILSNEGQKILDAIESQEIKTDLEGREFSSQKEFYKAVNSMVSEAENISIKLGYGNLKDLENLGFNYRETMENFSDTLCKVLEKGTVINDNGTFSVKLDNHSLLRMTDYMKEKMSSLGKYSQKPIYDINYKDKEFEKAIKDTEYFQKTFIQNVNSSLDRLKDNLTLEVENSNLPAYFFEKKVVNSKSYFTKKVAFLSILCFMIYGWHSLLKNIPESMMDNARVAGINNSFAEFFVSTGIFAETIYWGLAGLIGASISYGLANATSKSYYKMDKKRKLNNPKVRKRDLLKDTGFVLALTGAMTGSIIEGGGLLVNNIEDTYAQKIANDNKNAISRIIGVKEETEVKTAEIIENTTEIVEGKSSILGNGTGENMSIRKQSELEFGRMIDQVEVSDRNRLDLEGGERGGVGPIYIAKSYLTEGDEVLNNEILGRNTGAMNLVKDTDDKVKEFYSKNKFLDEEGKERSFKTYPEFLKFISEEQDRILEELGYKGIKIYSDLEKNKYITHILFHDETDKFKGYIKEAQEKLDKLKKQTDELQKIYGDFVDGIEKLGNSTYNSELNVTSLPELPNIDLESSLDDIINNQPKLEGKTVLEYPSLYIDMNEEGYVSNKDFAHTSLSVAARSSFLELGVGILLLLSLVHILNYRRAKGFSFEEQEKEISEYYDKLLDSIYKTFSGEHWKNIFPGHEGITKDEAEIILQRFLLEKEPSLKEWFFIEKKGVDLSKNGKTLKTLNKIVTGDFIGDREKFIDKLYKVFSEINDKAVSEGKVISSEDIEKIIYQVIPEKGSQKSSIVSNLFDKLRLKNFNENIGEIEIPREYLENISRENFEEYMYINVIENSKIYKTGDVYRLFSRYISSYENLGELKNLLDSYNGGISELDLMENIIKPKFLDFIDYDIEKLGEFQEELDKTLPEKVKVNDFLKAIEKSSGNKKIFLDKLLDVSKGEIFNFVSEIHITQENLSIMEKFLLEKFSYSEVQSFLYKLDPYIGKNITEEEFINLSKGILYDLDFNETIIKITQNLNEIYRLAFASRTKNFFVNPDNFKLEIKEISKEMISLGKKLEKMEDNPLTLELKKMFKDFEEGFKKLEFSSLNPFGNSKTLREFEEQKKLMEEYFLSIKSIFKKISENKSKLGKLADSTSKEGLEKLLSDIENISLKFDEDAEIVKEKFSEINSNLDSIKSSTEKTEVLDLETSKILKSLISLEGEIIKMDYLVSDNTKKALENLKKDFEKISLIDNLDNKEARIKSFSEEFEKYNKDLYEEVKNSLTAKIDEKINSLEGAGKSKYLEKFLKLKGRLIINQDTNFSNILNIKNDFEKYTETEKKFTENNRNKASIGKKFKGALKNVFKKSKPVSLEKQEIDDNSKKSPEIEYKPVEIEIPVEEINSEENNLKRFSLGKKLKKLFRKK